VIPNPWRPLPLPLPLWHNSMNYRVSIKSFPDYNIYYNKTKWNTIFFQNVTQLKKFLYNTSVHFNMCSFCIPLSFLVISVCNEGKTLCSPCIYVYIYMYIYIDIYIYTYIYIYIYIHTYIRALWACNVIRITPLVKSCSINKSQPCPQVDACQQGQSNTQFRKMHETLGN